MRILLIVLLLLGAQCLFAQTGILTGHVRDTADKKSLSNAVVSLLKKDSSLYKFTRTGKAGNFFLRDVSPGPYRLLVTYPKFADYSDDITVKPEGNNLGTVALTQKAQLLQAVIIKSAGAVRIKGDTTEFVADSFKVHEGATVEELLKKLPGFQVNSKGEITAQGQRVQKVLVDGEEFFGDDPTMATQNIGAKAVDKVQVFDTKTDQQNLTGISTGNEGKTVNIKLKEDAKKGYFGKAYAGSDFTKLIDAKALYNRFTGKRKFSVYGTKSDLNTGNLTWEEREKLGIDNDWEYDEISGYYFSFGSSDEFNDWSLRGLPHSYTAGALYSDKWNADRNAVNGSYRFNRLATDNLASTLTQNILQGSTTYRNKYQESQGLVQQHAGNFKYEWKIDSLTSLKYTGAATFKTNDLQSVINSEFLDANRQAINNSRQIVDNHTEKKQWDNQLQYKQMFKKKDRLLIATLRYGTVDDSQNGVIQTTTNFYKGGVLDSTDVADQQKMLTGSSQTIGGKITFNEPLSTKWAAVTEYAYNRNASTSHHNTFNKDLSGKYSMLDKTFSNNFDLDVFSHSGTLIFKYTTQKLRAAFGSGVSSVKLALNNLDSNKRNDYNFFNLTPQASIGYRFKPQTGLSFNYRGTTRNPSINQLQPIRDNQDRLNVFVGNPNLKVGFNHSFNLNFNTYKVLSQKGMWLSTGMDIPINDITFLTSINTTTGAQTYTPININGNKRYRLYWSYFKDGGEKKWGYSFNANGNGGTNNNYITQTVNGSTLSAKNKTDYLNSNLAFSLRYNHPEKIEVEFGPKVGYNVSKSSLQPTLNNNYWNYGATANLRLTLPGKFEVNSDIDFDLRQKLPAFPTNSNQIIWNAELAKKVFKSGSGKISLLANDLLDQRRGFNRNITSNFISEERFSRLSRYFLLKFEWTFNKLPGGKQ